MALPLLLETLQDPQLVAQFQRSCGLALKPKGEANGVALGYSSTQTLQGGREKTAGVKGVPQENGHKPYINGTYTNGTHRQGSVRKYVVHNYALYYLFRFAAALGQEVFYITFLPFTLWNIDSFIARRLIIVWCIVMYIGQASKDLLKWPRPSSPPVVKLETRVEAEYGMPSTHAIAATAISFTFLMAAVDRYQDVICGALIALLFIAVTFPVWDVMDQLILTNPICPVFAVVAGFLLSYNYPKLDHYSTTRADTTVILGVGAGTCVGVWIINLIGRTYVPLGVFPLGIPSLTYPMLLRQLLRFVLGVTLLVITRFIAKTLSLKALGSWYKVSTQDVLVRQKLEIEVPYKFVTYTSIGVVATSFVPWIYYLVNL
ncbi:hypothetical protein GDO81_007416 [Engystomops pustulosus]|uniref:Sphingosine-1-phosphate phosphatase 2 n=1 Tax=Engystomops pustulosus TaxID=76066 RepID=A0AAV7C8S9_ENGPU|nr:hypothetical protein GDO81_007416 [Engystomops pustulosus]